MKIAYISSGYLADCDLPLLNEMLNQGVDVFYFLLVSDDSKQATIININHLRPKGGLYPADSYPELNSLEKYIPLNHVYIVNMPIPHDWALSSFHAIWKLYSFIKNGKFDIVHITWPLTYGSFLLYLLRKKMILTMHDPIPHSSNMNIQNCFHRWVAFKFIKNFIVLSSSLRESFINTYNLHGKNVFVSKLGAYNVLLDTPSGEINHPKNYILFFGSINPHKGISYLCKAMEIVKEKKPSLQLVIAGRGSFDFDIKKYENTGNIMVINRFISDKELITLIKDCNFVVCPYIDATQSGVIMSAFALRKPVIGTNVGAIPEMLIHRRHGLLIPPKDHIAIANAILEMSSEETLNKMKNNIEADYESGNLSWSQIASENINIYRKIK